ncbi:MAG TPA: DUF92 domain-containing protein [archaeon]|nr:DUF92 domain-containing protein [archaeon]
MLFLSEQIIVGLLIVFFSIISYYKKSLDLNGILLGLVVGVITYLLGGIISFYLMILFYVSAESLTRIARKIKRKGKHEIRTTGNILGNSGAALIVLALGSTELMLNGFRFPGLMFQGFNVAFFGAMAAALSDTLSGEIGMLSKKKPFLITTLKEVETGTDGGISFLGLFAGIIFSALIGLIFHYLTGSFAGLIAVTAAGFIGTLTDSLLGATFERKKVLNNTSVNFLASLTGAVIAVLLFSFL